MTKPAHDNVQSAMWRQQMSRDLQGYSGPHWKKLKGEHADNPPKGIWG